MTEHKKSSWRRVRDDVSARKPEEKRRNYFNMFLTMFLAAAVIIAGFITPTIYYAVMDSDRGRVTVLADANEDSVSPHVFDEPVTLYPWNLYNIDNTSSLTSGDRTFLIDHNVPSFLITTMKAYGMDVEQIVQDTGQAPYEFATEQIINAFSFLSTDSDAGQGCFVIYSLDINKDGSPDLRCAVDQNGMIISLLFLSAPWTSESSGADTKSQIAEETATASSTGGTTAQNPNNPAEPSNTEALGPEGTPTAPNETEGAQQPDGTQQPDTTGASNAEAVNSINEDENPYSLDLDELEQMPVIEELSLWSYVHLIALSAAENRQFALADAASHIDAGFSNRYGSPAADGITEYNAPTPFATEEYELFIYDLPTNTRFILYYDASLSRCVGFNLQL